jgi:heavy metal translocating P-type ATPase
LNGDGGLLVQTTHTGRSSALGGIIDAVVDAQGTAAPIEALTDRISKIFVPAILLLSLITGLVWHFGFHHPKALVFAIDVLVIACPCALGLATPLAVVAATGIGSKNGLLIKNAAALQVAQELKYAVLDKTGTLTVGRPVTTALTWEGTPMEGVLYALNEKGTHPLNTALLNHLKAPATPLQVKRFKAIPGKGVQGKIDGTQWFLGSGRFFQETIGQQPPTIHQTHSLLFNEESLAAVICFEDSIHPDAPALIQMLHDRGIEPIIASGDNTASVAKTASALGITTFKGEMQPTDKTDFVKSYQAKGRTLMIGDGINDSIALNAADIGVSMAHGTAVAQESADVVLTREGLPQLAQYFKLSTITMGTIRGNLYWAFGYNLIAIPVAAGLFSGTYGLELTPMMASIAMSFSSLGVVANSLRMHQKSLSK